MLAATAAPGTIGRMNTQPLIALLTDFGLADAYVGTMKGVILSICRSAHLVDLTHSIRPQNVRQAAYVLMTAFRHFPPDTVFLVVVDPGVGTERQPIAVETAHGVYVAPNNGVLSYVLPHLEVRRAVVLAEPRYQLPGPSMTFHGRDIFAPAAAHLAAGVPITALGPTLPELVKLDPPRLAIGSGAIEGEIIHIDHFGNVITSIGHLAWEGDDLILTPQFGAGSESVRVAAGDFRVSIGGRTISGVQPTYGRTAPGTLLALVGSSGQLEVGVNQGSAADTLGASLGDPVRVSFGE